MTSADHPSRLDQLDQLSMTEILRWQARLEQELKRRFEFSRALLFSDMVGSSSYFQRFGDAAGRQLQQIHQDLLQAAASQHGGRVVDTAGDGVFLVFSDSAQALAAVQQVQAQLSERNLAHARPHQLQLRMGLHWGRVLSDGQSVSGDAVNFCARVLASGEPGEVRLSREAFQELPAAWRVQCRPLAPTLLKDVAGAVELMAFDWRDRSTFPTHVLIGDAKEPQALPLLDIISFGRLREHEGVPANDVVLSHVDPLQALQISRWHFELRCGAQCMVLRALSDSVTLVDGQPAPKGQDLPVRVGCRIDVAHVLSLRLLAPLSRHAPDADQTLVSLSRARLDLAAVAAAGPLPGEIPAGLNRPGS
ncbi:adenylate/guanylate cyclase domain-containing protein [Roseateles sp.]|uniref:adenylate/guanylate cyclase domain-containing protein n=1 Tax=Roseateles sp. TaxID=1971397 RepID=UPI003D0E609A